MVLTRQWGNASFGRKSPSQPRVNRTALQTSAFAPLHWRESKFPDSDEHSRRSIANLLCTSRPATVFRRVALRVVDSVNAVRHRRPRAHVGVEVLEALPPAVADGNASATVPGVSGVVGILAAREKASPDSVFCSGRHAMRSGPVSGGFPAVATAGLGDAAAHVVAIDDALCSAVAAAVPAETIDLRGNNPATKALADEIHMHILPRGGG